jgi:dolichol-phosphate mannosyltransferase
MRVHSMSKYARSVSVMVPALNEQESLAATIVQLVEALHITVEDYEILVINDGSTDRTGVIADALAGENARIRVFHHAHPMGLGECYRQGIHEATKNCYVFVPGDNGWPADSLVTLFQGIGSADIVTSYVSNPQVRPLGRRLISRLYTCVLNTLFRKRVRYYNGLTIYPLSFLKRSPFRTNGFGYQAELLLRALQTGMSLIEIALPINERVSGVSKALRLRNLGSVIWTVMRLYCQLGVPRSGCWSGQPRERDDGRSRGVPGSTCLDLTGYTR